MFLNQEVESLVLSKKKFVTATIVQFSGSSPREVGTKIYILEDGRFLGTIGGGHFESLVIKQAQAVLKSGKALLQKYPLGAKTGQCCGGVVDVFFEVFNFRPKLYLFGAGHVGLEVCHVLKNSYFDLTVIDPRSEWLEKIETPVTKHLGKWDEFIDLYEFSRENSYFVVMTHQHDMDQSIIEFLLDKPMRYLGLIGSHSKFERFKQRLRHKEFHPDFFKRIRCPIGVDIGGKSPVEVAISLSAELIGIWNGKISSNTI